jgi:hypothetical protein
MKVFYDWYVLTPTELSFLWSTFLISSLLKKEGHTTKVLGSFEVSKEQSNQEEEGTLFFAKSL